MNLEDIDLEKAVLLLAYWNNPDVNISAIVKRLNLLAEEIGSHIPDADRPHSIIDHINHFLFEKFGLQGNTTDYYNPENSFIDRVLENKKGIPITLSVLYILIAKRLELPIVGVPMPAHFITKYDDGTVEIFFDTFYGGKIYSRRECLKFLQHAHVNNVSSILDGCPNYQIISRMMHNIQLVYSSYKDDPKKNEEIEQMLNLLERHYQ